MSEQTEKFRHLAAGLAAHWDTPLTDARRKKLVDYTTDLVDILISYADDDNGGKLVGWDSRLDDMCVSDIVDNYLWDRRLILERRGETVGRLGNQISCCIRAALDIVVAPSAGVIGFTAGDFRRVFDGELPEWVSGWFEPALTNEVLDSEKVWA
ncbi:hypothetical protein ACIOWK_32580 [Pseudomonas protegens]|uniref:hypothetical protein n=1 Tax=Pseudomonas protegens TaxID=380021 RepID=UPI003800FD82